MDFSERLKFLRKNKKITQEQLAAIIGVERSSVGKYESANVIPSFDVLGKMSEYFGVTIDYLLGNPAPSLPSNVHPIKLKRFPVLGEIACGKPIFASEDHETYIDASADIKADFCLIAKGDSMTGARINNGDVVFIREQPTVENGEIAAVIIGEEATLKRWYFYPEKKKLVLNPENPAFEPLVYIGPELNEVRCLGKAVSFMSKL